MANLIVSAIAEWNGKALTQGQKQIKGFERSVKSLGSSLGIAFSGAALGYAVKSTIKDFADAERETITLTNTVKNLGLAFDAPAVSNYVNQIGKLYGVTGQQAVPAMQALLTATGSVSKSTEIMNTALNLAASRNADVASVASDLANAYVGNTRGLNQYRLGLTKAELAAMSFDEILEKIGKDTLGAADEAAKSLSGQLAILAEASNQAKERIGGGLVEALGGLGGPNGAGGAAANIENLSIKLTNAITGFGYLVDKVKIAQPILVAAGIAIGLAWAPWFTAISVAALAIGAIGNAINKNKPKIALNTGPLMFPTAGDGGYAEREKARKKAENEAISRNKQLAKLIKDQAKSATDALKKKQLQNAIDKANLALNKSDTVFNLEKIQLAAADQNQARQLGNITSQAQLLQITNDRIRLQIKKDIIDLDEAIASGDIKAIEAATKRLNEDIKILGKLENQALKLSEIEDILKRIAPKDLINLDNLRQALALLKQIGGGGSAAAVTSTAKAPVMPPGFGGGNFVGGKPLGGGPVGGYKFSAGDYQYLEDAESYMYGDLFANGNNPFTSTSNTSGGNTIIVNAGVGDPNAIAEAIDQLLIDAVQRGTLRPTL